MAINNLEQAAIDAASTGVGKGTQSPDIFDPTYMGTQTPDVYDPNIYGTPSIGTQSPDITRVPQYADRPGDEWMSHVPEAYGQLPDVIRQQRTLQAQQLREGVPEVIRQAAQPMTRRGLFGSGLQLEDIGQAGLQRQQAIQNAELLAKIDPLKAQIAMGDLAQQRGTQRAQESRRRYEKEESYSQQQKARDDLMKQAAASGILSTLTGRNPISDLLFGKQTSPLEQALLASVTGGKGLGTGASQQGLVQKLLSSIGGVLGIGGGTKTPPEPDYSRVNLSGAGTGIGEELYQYDDPLDFGDNLEEYTDSSLLTSQYEQQFPGTLDVDVFDDEFDFGGTSSPTRTDGLGEVGNKLETKMTPSGPKTGGPISEFNYIQGGYDPDLLGSVDTTDDYDFAMEGNLGTTSPFGTGMDALSIQMPQDYYGQTPVGTEFTSSAQTTPSPSTFSYAPSSLPQGGGAGSLDQTPTDKYLLEGYTAGMGTGEGGSMYGDLDLPTYGGFGEGVDLGTEGWDFIDDVGEGTNIFSEAGQAAGELVDKIPFKSTLGALAIASALNPEGIKGVAKNPLSFIGPQIMGAGKVGIGNIAGSLLKGQMPSFAGAAMSPLAASVVGLPMALMGMGAASRKKSRARDEAEELRNRAGSAPFNFVPGGLWGVGNRRRSPALDEASGHFTVTDQLTGLDKIYLENPGRSVMDGDSLSKRGQDFGREAGVDYTNPDPDIQNTSQKWLGKQQVYSELIPGLKPIFMAGLKGQMPREKVEDMVAEISNSFFEENPAIRQISGINKRIKDIKHFEADELGLGSSWVVDQIIELEKEREDLKYQVPNSWKQMAYFKPQIIIEEIIEDEQG